MQHMYQSRDDPARIPLDSFEIALAGIGSWTGGKLGHRSSVLVNTR